MNEIKKLRDNLYMYNNSYFNSLQEAYDFINSKFGYTATQKTDEQILEEMDISVIERFLRKKKLELLNKK